MKKMKVFVGVSGASGAQYAQKLLTELVRLGIETHAAVTTDGLTNLVLETGIEAETPAQWMDKAGLTAVTLHDVNNLAAAPSSGSAMFSHYLVTPASMGVVGRIAGGISGNLVERAADVALKEGRPLIVLFREAPLNQIHLENLLRLSRAGATIVPASPAFYQGPETIDDLIAFMTGKIFDIMGIEHSLFHRWS